MPVLIVLLILAAFVLLISLICFLLVFYSPKQNPPGPDEYPFPKGAIYEPYRDLMTTWMNAARTLPHEDLYVTSYDGLRLFGRYYEKYPGAPMEIMFHGYRGTGERDLCVGIQRAFSIGRNVLIVEQRAGVGSNARIITFGVREYRDCLAWVDFAVKKFGPDVQIILTGISMGATTVLMAAGQPLPPQVKGVLADCGFTSAKEIIQKVSRQIHLPGKLVYPLVWLGARLFGGFDLSQSDVPKALQTCTVPVVFIHGESDDFVPCSMSRRNYEACPSSKALLTVPGAGHGLAYMGDPDGYLDILCRFFTENGVPTALVEKTEIP